MHSTCPRCGELVQAGDRFCAHCGASLIGDSTNDHYTPVPGVTQPPDLRVRRKRSVRRAWYRRKLVLIPLGFLLFLGALAGGLYLYIEDTFDTINSLSTVPAEITGEQLGGDESLTVDTGPAQEAVRRRQQGDAADPTPTPAGDAVTLDEGGRVLIPVDAGWQVMTFSMQGATPVGGTPEPIQLPVADTGESILVLLMGVDARPGEAIDVGVRPDTLAVLNLDPETGDCRILAIPRDSRVELPGYGLSKVNHALAVGGIPYQMLVVEDLLGIRFDHYGLVDFAGAERIVEELGGITVENEEAFTFEGEEFPAGELELNGEETLTYVRYRGGEDGDFGRQRRQQEVVRAMLAEGRDLDVVTAIPDLLDALEGHIRTDAGPSTLIDLGREFQPTCTAETLDAKRINGEVATLHDAIFNEPLSFVLLEEDEVVEKREWLLTGEEPPTATPAATPVAPEASPVAFRASNDDISLVR